MAEVEEKQTEAVNAEEEQQPGKKKSKKSRKTKAAVAKEGDGAEGGKDEAAEKPKKHRSRNMDNPSIHDMVVEALDVLDERKGVTLVAIKRYLEENYHVDMVKLAYAVRKVLVNGVENGDIIRTRGAGASGRFKVKHIKPTVIKKRKAPEDYQQIPYLVKKRNPKPKKAAPTPSKAKKVEAPKTKTPAKNLQGKKGRTGGKRK